MKIAFSTLCALAVLATGPSAFAQSVSLQQVVTDRFPTLRLVIDALGHGGEELSTLATSDVTVRGPGEIKVTDVRKLTAADGVAYIVMIDVSKSAAARFAALLQALQRAIAQVTTEDRMAIVAFGDNVTVQDFSSDQSALLLAAKKLTPTSENTALYEGFKTAMTLVRRGDVGLPLRRSILVLSDGQNSPPAGRTEDDVVREIEREAAPIYAIDASPAGKGAPQCSPTLLRITRVSNGICERLGSRSIDAMYERTRSAVRRVFIIQAECPQCPADGTSREYWVEVRFGSAVPRSNIRAVTIHAPPPPPPQPESPLPPKPQGLTPLQWALIGVGVLAVVGLIVWLMRSGTAPTATAAEPPSEVIPQPVVPAQPPAPNAMLTFVVMGASSGGQKYRHALVERATLGSGSQCQIRVDDPAVAERQCEFLWNNNAVYVRELAAESPTLVGGAQLRASRPVENGETLRIGNTQLRILIEDAAPVG